LQICIPFCVRQCSYCDYPYCTYDPGTLRAYRDALLAEIDSCIGEFPDHQVDAISIEGGSPALLGPDALFQVLLRVRKVFSCASDLQISLQTMPGDYSRALMEKMRDAGVNHWIIGLETTQASEHELLKRPYKFDAVTMVDMAVRTFAPRALSFDLLAGLPGQTERSLKRSLEHCLFYAPEHMSIYPLRIHAGSEMEAAASACENGSASDQAAVLEDYAAAVLKESGFTRYTKYDYSRDGHVHRYRPKYLQGCEHLGIGYHAESWVDGVMWKNGHSLQEYIDHSAEFDVIASGLMRPDEAGIEKMRKKRQALLYPAVPGTLPQPAAAGTEK
ncbi:MAG: radical SAM protein, partial [Lachnospiraceae bacterium]|nr:radical SAM protein [Lachnospiraceae bacterium]